MQHDNGKRNACSDLRMKEARVRPEFDAIYRDVLEVYSLSFLLEQPGSPFPRRLDAMRLVRTAIEQAERGLPSEVSLRPDARLL